MALSNSEGRYTTGPYKGHKYQCSRVAGYRRCNCKGVGEQAIRTLSIGDAAYWGGRKQIVVKIQTPVAPTTTWTLYLTGVHLTGSLKWIGEEITRITLKSRLRKTSTRKNYEFAAANTKPLGFEHERNDCTVRALSECFNIPYGDAHNHLKQYGRNDRHGMKKTKEAYASARFNGNRLNLWHVTQTHAAAGKALIETVTLGALLKSGALPERCILRVRGHVIAVLKGVVHDSHRTGSRAEVHSVWELVKEA